MQHSSKNPRSYLFVRYFLINYFLVFGLFQTTVFSQTPPLTVNLDIALIGDNFLYNKFGGANNPDAVAQAKAYMQAIVADPHAAYNNIFDAVAPMQYTYNINIVTIDVITTNTGFYNGSSNVNFTKFGQWWQNAYPCAVSRPEIIHVISGLRPGAAETGSANFYGVTPPQTNF